MVNNEIMFNLELLYLLPKHSKMRYGNIYACQNKARKYYLEMRISVHSRRIMYFPLKVIREHA